MREAIARSLIRQRVVVFALVLGVVCLRPAFALTVSEWLDKAQSWFNARDDGAFAATFSTYEVDSNGNENLKCQTQVRYKDTPNVGWSTRIDTVLDYGEYGSVTYKLVRTPDGDQAYLGDTCVYTESSHELVSTFVPKSHLVTPKYFYMGISGQTNLQSYEQASTSGTADETVLQGGAAYRLATTWDIGAWNDLLVDTNKHLDSTADTWTSEDYIKASDGEPMETKATLYIGAQDKTYHMVYRWSNVNTNPSIPSNTFDLTTATPSMTVEEALQAWLEAHCK